MRVDRTVYDQDDTPLLGGSPVRPRDRQPRALGLGPHMEPIDTDTGEEVPEDEIEEAS